ncbi:MAG: YggS family pyridoxal phosphate-dependent enzyme [Tidjanibacter sp.]|nr:YggS family pyridoxal phosphate-dependent enzyme [Tidjanibacter sp.]
MSIKQQISHLHTTLPQGVTLVAVSKFHPAEAIREAYDAGQRIFGESRPQEMAAKVAVLPNDIQWHMIGHLQTNKVKMIAPFVSLIHSVDSEKLVAEINRQAEKNQRTIEILFEVHLAEDETKSGWNANELRDFISSGAMEQYPFVLVRGLMTIGTLTDDIELNKCEFRQLKAMFDQLQPYFGAEFDTLSMGMTSDYCEAIECGSTMVRIGSMIFGERVY